MTLEERLGAIMTDLAGIVVTASSLRDDHEQDIAFSSRVLPAALGRGVAAAVSAELDQSHLNEAIAALREIPEVLECHAPAGDTDLLIRVVATSPDDLYRVSEEIRLCPGIIRTSTSMFLREVIPYRTTGLLST